MAQQPNILFFLSDQQQWQSICGRSPARSPHVNRLAAEGLRFERCYATVALCCPSRAALISGQWPYHNGILNQVHVPERTRWDMEPDVITYSQRLHDAGYRLGYVGKWHASWRRTPLDFGFHDLRAPSGWWPENLRALREAGLLGEEDDLQVHRRRLGIANYGSNVPHHQRRGAARPLPSARPVRAPLRPARCPASQQLVRHGARGEA